MKAKWIDRLHKYRFEFLTVTLLMLLFDRAAFSDGYFFASYVWPLNMVALGFASFGIFREKRLWVRVVKNIIFLSTILIAINFVQIIQYRHLTQLSFIIYATYYIWILVEVLVQITSRTETNISVVFGSISGFLLIIVIAIFAFILLEYNVPGSFSGLSGHSVNDIYNELSYFSMVTLATVGYGDITPKTEISRLVTMFFALAGQFYLVALMGIIISQFSSRGGKGQ